MSETYNILDDEEMNQKISYSECMKLRDIMGKLTCAPFLTKREYVRFMTVIDGVLKRMEKEGDAE